jgi:hypothetical protein
LALMNSMRIGLLDDPGAEAPAAGGDERRRVADPALGHVEVEEARAGHFDPLDGVAEPLVDGGSQLGRDVPRRLADQRRGEHRDVRRVVAELGPRRPLEARSGNRRVKLGGRRGDRLAQIGRRVRLRLHGRGL